MKRNYGMTYASPVFAWLNFFFVIPLGIICVYSLMQKGLYGGVVGHFTFDAYRSLANSTLLGIAAVTTYIAAMSTALMIGLALPAAYFIARSRHKNLWLLLVIVPFWTNFLIRIYAWIAILGNNGFLNHLLLSLGWIHDPVQFLYNQNAVIIVTVYTYLPFAILPLFSAIEKFDFSLLEAARDLGATKWQSIQKILLPSIRGGLTTAILFTFIPSFGSYAIPQIIGGRDSLMLGNVIARELTVTRNWPLSSSISVMLTFITALGVLLFVKSQGNVAERLKKIREEDVEG
jgi:spermidine/putrescine transport system permease protein